MYESVGSNASFPIPGSKVAYVCTEDVEIKVIRVFQCLDLYIMGCMLCNVLRVWKVMWVSSIKIYIKNYFYVL